MSQQNQIQNPVQKQMVCVITRYGQIVAVYQKLDDALIVIKDYVLKGVPFDLSCKFVQ